MKKILLPLMILLSASAMLYAAGTKESSTSSDRAMYLSNRGYITPADQIEIDAYISQVDYDYPVPKDTPVNFIVDAEQKGELAYLQIGMKGRKTAFRNLPKFNLAFVIDVSGSMYIADKLDWVKDSFEIFIENVRPQDYVSLIAFSTDVSVLFPATQMATYNEKLLLKNAVQRMNAYGGTNVYDGLAAGYQEVIANYDRDYVNRVILLTDGEHNSGSHTTDDIINLAEKYKNFNINVSCIALGTDSDVNLMVDTATAGGGSSRFISNHEKMVETFGTELDRLLVPAARSLRMQLRLAEDVKLIDTWGYESSVDGQVISYELDTIHNGDYETILSEVLLPPEFDASQPVGWFSSVYEDLEGNPLVFEETPVFLMEKPADKADEITGTRLMQSEAYVRLGRLLISIAEKSDAINRLQKDYVALMNADRAETVSLNGEPVPQLDSASSVNPESMQQAALLKEEIIYRLKECIVRIRAMYEDLARIDDALDGEQFTKDLTILQNYTVTFQNSLASYEEQNQQE